MPRPSTDYQDAPSVPKTTESHVVRADANDDIASLSPRLELVQGDFVAVVIPSDNQHLDSPLSMRLLRRQAAANGLELAIVTTSSIIRAIAEEEGIPVYPSVATFERVLFRAESPTRLDETLAALPDRIRSMGSVLFVYCLIAVGFVLALLLLPVATVRVAPVTEAVNGTVSVVADPDARLPDVETKRIPSRTIHLLIEGTEQLDIAAKQTNGEARATGVVTLTNRTELQVMVPANTVLSTDDGIGFHTLDEVVLPARAGATARVRVVATDHGARGNVGRLKISRVEGALRNSLSVLNEEPTVGGGAATQTIVTTADLEQIERQLIEKGKREAATRLGTQVQEGELLIPESVMFTPLVIKFDRQVGEEARVVTGRIQARATGSIVNMDDVDYLARQLFKPKLREDFVLPPERVVVKPPKVAGLDGRLLRLDVPVEGLSHARLNTERIREYVRLQPTSEAQQRLAAEFPLAGAPKINVSPSWTGRAYRVDVIVEPVPEAPNSDQGTPGRSSSTH